jgi:hypothetical protein
MVFVVLFPKELFVSLFILFCMSVPDILLNCPVCGRRLRVVDSARLCRLVFVWCPNSRCRFCVLFDTALGLLDGLVFYFNADNKVVSCLVDLRQTGSMILLQKRGVTKAEDAIGVKICAPRFDGSPDFSKPAVIVWMGALKALLRGEGNISGNLLWVPVYESLPLGPKKPV